jgi:hypothetical protein
LHPAIVRRAGFLKITPGTAHAKGPPKRAWSVGRGGSATVEFHHQWHDQQRHDVDDLDQWVDGRRDHVLAGIASDLGKYPASGPDTVNLSHSPADVRKPCESKMGVNP